ncbi:MULTISPECIES: HlyD family efflux transporter periplasmic adaptor subunit, partial [unclassified Streptomyces]|uniref:HlyD family efflux transporter periplasmic adaptor subunit n=1 Tax=unclassified Streptomyces TaxID=2593676 RepID=UPI00081F1127
RLRSSDDFDVPVRLAPTRSVVALAVTVVLLAAGAVWSFAGSLPRTMRAPGVLTHTDGSFFLHSPVPGRIERVDVVEGVLFPKGTVLFTVRNDTGEHPVRSAVAGRVTSLLAATGATVTPKDELAVVERVAGAGDPLIAVVYVPAPDAVHIHPGTAADLEVETVSAQRYGVLRGTVVSVGRFPQTPEQITAFLADPLLGRELTAQGEPVAVTVRLAPAPTASGFRWSTGEGPPYRIDSRLVAAVDLHLPPVRPITWMVS